MLARKYPDAFIESQLIWNEDEPFWKRYVRRAAGKLGASFRPEPDGFVAQRARQVLAESIDLLRRIGAQGLLTAIAEGTFGVTKRPPDGGRGLDGVVERAEEYFNPASELLEANQ